MGAIELRVAHGEPAIYIAELSADNLRLGKLNDMPAQEAQRNGEEERAEPDGERSQTEGSAP